MEFVAYNAVVGRAFCIWLPQLGTGCVLFRYNLLTVRNL